MRAGTTPARTEHTEQHTKEVIMIDVTSASHLEHLRQIAANASQGPWTVSSVQCASEYGDYVAYGVEPISQADQSSDSSPAFGYCEPMSEEDAAFVAACDPNTVLALIAEIEYLRAGLS